MVTTQQLFITAKYLVARDGASQAMAFAANGLQAMIDARQHALIPDWQALSELIHDAALGRLPETLPTLH